MTTTESRRFASPAYAGWALGLLVLVYTSNFIDRTIVSTLGQAIKRDLQLTDLQLGLLGGLSFAVFYTALGIPIARLAERKSRVGIIAASLAVWSLMTAFCGMAQTFSQLLMARIGVGIGEAGATPAAQSLISDTVSPERRASALAVYSLGIPLGTLIGAAAGGWIAENLSWRVAFLIVGLPGVALALVVRFTLKEPPRGGSKEAAEAPPPPLSALLKRLARRPSGLHMAAAASLASVAGYGIAYFIPPFLIRAHGLGLAQAGLLTGLIGGFPGAASLLAGGWLADRLGRRDPRAYALVPAAALLLSAPLCLLAFQAGDWRIAAAMLAVAALVQTAYLPPTFALAHNLVEPRMRASATALLFFFINLIGLGIGPTLVGGLSDRFGLKAALSLCALFYLWAALHALLAARRLKADLAKD